MMSFDVHWCWCWMLEQPLIREIIDRGLKGLHSRYLSLGFFSDRPGFLCVPGPCRGEPQGSDLGFSPLDLFSLSVFYVKFSCCLISRCYHRTWRSLEFLLTSRENGFTLKNQNLLFFFFFYHFSKAHWNENKLWRSPTKTCSKLLNDLPLDTQSFDSVLAETSETMSAP